MHRPAVWFVLATCLSGCEWESWEGPVLVPGDLEVGGLEPGLLLGANEVSLESSVVLSLNLYLAKGNASASADVPMIVGEDGTWHAVETLVETGEGGIVVYDESTAEPFPVRMSATLLIDGFDAGDSVVDLGKLGALLEIPAPGIGVVELWRGWSVHFTPEWELSPNSNSHTDPSLVGYATAEPEE